MNTNTLDHLEIGYTVNNRQDVSAPGKKPTLIENITYMLCMLFKTVWAVSISPIANFEGFFLTKKLLFIHIN